MRVDPVTDVLAFLTKPLYGEPAWLHDIFWLLAILSASIAVAAWRVFPGQARPLNLLRFVVRFLVASFWWQQSLWAFPTDTSILLYWTDREVQHAAFTLQKMIVKFLILPAFVPFAYAVYGFEIVVAIALFLGLYVRAVSALAALFVFSLFLGLYHAPQEWPWSYAFVTILLVVMAIESYGEALGLDAYRAARSPAAKRRKAAAVAV